MDGRERSAGVQPAKRPALAHLASRALASSRKTTRALLTLWKGLCYFMDVKANEDVPLGVHHPPHPAHAVLFRALARQGLGWNERGRLCAHSDRIEPSSLDPWLFCAGRKKVLALGDGGVLSYAAFSGSGQLGRTVNPLALPSYVRIVDPPPFFARGFGHGFFVLWRRISTKTRAPQCAPG